MLLCELNADDSVEDILVALADTTFGPEIMVAGDLARGEKNPATVVVFVDLRARPMTKARQRAISEFLGLYRRFFGRLMVFIKTPNHLKIVNASGTDWIDAGNADKVWKSMVRECRRLTEFTAEGASPEQVPGHLPPTNDNIEHAKAFLLRKWKEICNRRGSAVPYDLGNAGSISAAFANLIFGGTIEGSMRHFYVRSASGDIIDLASDSDAITRLVNPYKHVPSFWTNTQSERVERIKSQITPWVAEFLAETKGDLLV